MTDMRQTFGDDEFEQMVRDTAYHLWERDGRPFGGEKYYWFLALEKCLRQRTEEEREQRGLLDPM